jgi:hypothetical protein
MSCGLRYCRCFNSKLKTQNPKLITSFRSVFIRVHLGLIRLFFGHGPGNTRTTVDLNHRRIIHEPKPSFLRDLGAWPLHLFPFVPLW